jgi:hypothetical protein
MENIEIYKTDSLDFKLKRKGDLLYYEGPLVSHFVNIEHPTQHYLYKWCDFDSNCNRWAIFKVSVDALLDFLTGKLTLLQLVRKNPYIFFVDLDAHLNPQNTFVCPTAKIPEDYLPTEDSFYDPLQYESYAIQLKNDLSKPTNVSDYDKFLDMFETIKREVSDIKIAQQKHDESLLKLLAKQMR